MLFLYINFYPILNAGCDAWGAGVPFFQFSFFSDGGLLLLAHQNIVGITRAVRS